MYSGAPVASFIFAFAPVWSAFFMFVTPDDVAIYLHGANCEAYDFFSHVILP